MTNKELGEFISSQNFKNTSNELLEKSEEIIGAGADVVSTVFLGFPANSFLKPFIEGIKDWKSRVELKQLAYYLKEFDNLNQSERSDFSLIVQKNEEDFTERLFYYISQLNDKRKASLCGKLGVNYARKKIQSSMFLRLVEVVKNSNYEDLKSLKSILSLDNDFDGLDFKERKAYFTSVRFAKSRISHFENFRKTALRNLGLIESKIDLKSVKLPAVNFSLEQVKEAVRNIREKDSFSEITFYLFEYGLNLLDKKEE